MTPDEEALIIGRMVIEYCVVCRQIVTTIPADSNPHTATGGACCPASGATTSATPASMK